jgi:hypothetical protein
MEKIDLNRVKRSLRVMANQTALPDQPASYLFDYAVWTFVQGEKHETLTEQQAEGKLNDLPDMDVYYCKLVGSPSVLPTILKGRKNVTTKEVSGHKELSDYIFNITGVKVPETDLMVKQNFFR